MTVETSEGVEFDPFSDTFFLDPYSTYKRMRDEAPVYYSEKYDFYALSRYDDVAWGQKDYETFSSAYGIELAMVKSGKKPPTMIIMMDPPEHRRHRSLVNRVFTPRAIANMEPMIREVISGFLAQCDPTSFDGIQDFAAYFPVEIICRMLGIPAESRQQIRLWIDKSLVREAGSYKLTSDGFKASVEMGTFFYQLISERRTNLQDDMISDLIRAEVTREEDGESAQLSDIEIAGFLSLLGGAGAETVIKLVGNAMVLFAEHPEQWAELRANRELIPSAVEEVLRHQAPSQYNVRKSVKDVELHGVRIPAGSPVLMLVGSANRDEQAIPDADVFNIKRTVDQGASKNIGFGYGVHSCLGAALARLEGRVALELLLDFVPEYTVDRDSMKRVACSNVAGWSSFQVHLTKPGETA